MEETFPSAPANEPKRTPLLSFLLILSFAGSGMMLFAFLMIGLFYDNFVLITQSPALIMPGKEIVVNTPPWAFFFGFLFYSLSLSGTIYMWQLKKTGFHIYTLSQFFLLFLSTYVIYPREITLGDLLFSVMFVLLYATHLKLMK
ncbi:MAG: hypothetical protein WCO63_02400 [Bacteroidota bacterium]